MTLAVSALTILSMLWACPALAIQWPSRDRRWRLFAASAWGAFGLIAIVLLWAGLGSAALVVYALGFAALLVWWLSLKPSHDREWADDVARVTTGDVDGSRVTLRNVRNFDWRSPTDYDPRWEIRHYDLDGLRTVDAALSYWMGPAIAHTLVSFGFVDGRHVTFSIEIRKKRGEKYSAIGGFFRQFEACLVAADERDILGVRTNVRGEDVYLYRINLPADAMRELFLAYVRTSQELARTPRFYNTLTANCTTVVYEMVKRIVDGLPFDRRLLLSGYLPAYLFRVEGLVPGHSLESLREVGRITDRARAAGSSVDFSTLIRRGVPGYDERGAPVPLPSP